MIAASMPRGWKSERMSDFDDVRCLDVALADKLQIYSSKMKGRVPDVADAYQRLVDRLRAAGAGSEALGIGDRFPAFALPDASGRIRRLEDFLVEGPLVASFNRGHWCAFCRMELLELQGIHEEIRSYGANLVSVQPETAQFTHRLKSEFGIGFPVLTDLDNGFALRANLMIALGSAVQEAFRKRGTELALFQGGNAAWFVPIPATYVIDTSGMIAGAHVDPDFRNRMAPAEILSALEAIKAKN